MPARPMQRKLLWWILFLLVAAAVMLVLPSLVHEDPAPVEPASGSVARSAGKKPARSGSSLRKPRPKACLTPDAFDPDGGGEMGAVRVGVGLSRGQIDTAFAPMLESLAACRPDDGGDHSGHATFELLVGCDGVVSAVDVADDSLYEPGMIACLRERLTYVEFPAHDRREGVVFEYPLIFH